MIKHRTFIFIIASLLATAFIVSSAMASRGIVPVSIKDKSGNEIGLYKESHALVIGVSDYTNGWQDLESVPGEVNDLVSALEAQGFHVVKVMNPSSKTLENSFKNFINQYGFDPDNRLLFFYSGHGHTRQVGNITKGYLVPTDAPIPDSDPKGFKNKALSMKRVIAWAEGEIESKHALFLFDSCFSGTILKSRSKPPIPRPIKDSTNHPVRQFISAGSAGQLVPSQSVFAPYFIRALKGDGDMNQDGYVTGTELGLYLRDQIMGGDTHQTPQVGKSFNPNFNEGDFVFPLKTASLTQKPSNTPPPAPAVPAPPSAMILEGHLQINVNASNSQIAINGENKGTASPGRPLNLQGLSTGSMRVVVKAEGFDPIEKTVTIKRNQWTQEVFELSRMKVASLPPPASPKSKSSGNCPNKMSFIPGGVYLAGHVGSLKDMSINALCMDKYEVTQGDFERVMGNNPSYTKGTYRPVVAVNWHEAKAYCEKVGKRLPTEWEWEKAAKAGSTTTYYWGNDPSSVYAWYGEGYGSGSRLHFVGQKKPNAFGLYDMSGNVYEWTSSDYNKSDKVIRSGSWINGPSRMRSADRDWSGSMLHSVDLGFRCAK
jgi:hypothetical protein